MANNKVSFNLDDRKKRILTIAGVAAVIVIFASFLLSLSDDKEEITSSTTDTIELEQNVDTNKVPASVRYDFDNDASVDNAQEQGSLADMLNDEDSTSNQDTSIDSTQGQIENTPAPTENASESLAPGIDTSVNVEAKAYLYCDEFSSKEKAQEAKAKIAFLGVISNVDTYNNKISLKIGPFESRDKARAKFQELNSKALVSTCTLIDE